MIELRCEYLSVRCIYAPYRFTLWIHSETRVDTPCGFTLKRVRDMIRTYNHIKCILAKSVINCEMEYCFQKFLTFLQLFVVNFEHLIRLLIVIFFAQLYSE